MPAVAPHVDPRFDQAAPRFTTCDSPVGVLTLVAVGDRLSGVHFGDDGDRHGSRVHPADVPVLARAADQLGEYFAGRRTRFDLLLHLDGTPFQVEAWKALSRAVFGSTMTYSDQARAIGRPRAVRAVGAANSRNPVAIVLPCHRVVGANGALTGFAGGLDIKRWLLDHEASVRDRGSAPGAEHDKMATR